MVRVNLQFFGGRGASSASSSGSNVFGKQGKPKTPEEALATTNPNYRNGREYRVNCQRCVLAYELQRQGYGVEALPATMNGNDPMFSNRRWMVGFENQTWSRQGELGSRNSAVEKNIIGKMQNWGDGSRAIAYVEWKHGNAHVFNIENRGGKVSIFEAQSGKTYSLNAYLSISKPSKTMISRVDNLKPNEGVMQYAVKTKGR